MKYILLGLIIAIKTIFALHDGDRILSAVQVLHSGWKTPYLDLSLVQMPRFRSPSSTMLRLPLPRPDENGPEMTPNSEDDIKASFAFADGKLVVPWIVVYDHRKKRMITKIIFTFAHDEFDVLRVYSDMEYKKQDNFYSETKIDIEIPYIELIFDYEGVQDEDLAKGVFYMFLFTIFAFIIIVMIVFATYDKRFRMKETNKSVNTHRTVNLKDSNLNLNPNLNPRHRPDKLKQ
jgi:hypothetical protein